MADIIVTFLLKVLSGNNLFGAYNHLLEHRNIKFKLDYAYILM